jgi:hypothetical protein
MNRPIFLQIWSLKKNSIAVIASIAVIFVVLTVSSASGVTIVNAQKSSPPPDHYVVQETAESTVDPLPGHQGHQLVIAIPPRDDGKIWTGTISWTASYPVEMVVLHTYDNTSASGNATFGKPLTAPFGKGEVAISLIKNPSNTPIPRAEDLSKTSK